MPPQSLFPGVAVERFGAGVPASYATLRIEHVDGAVLDGIDDEPRAPLALAQRLLDLAPGLNVLEQPSIARRQRARASARRLEEERAQTQQRGKRGSKRERRLGEDRVG